MGEWVARSRSESQCDGTYLSRERERVHGGGLPRATGTYLSRDARERERVHGGGLPLHSAEAGDCNERVPERQFIRADIDAGERVRGTLAFVHGKRPRNARSRSESQCDGTYLSRERERVTESTTRERERVRTEGEGERCQRGVHTSHWYPLRPGSRGRASRRATG
jgi:hypothetical protein